MGCEVALPHYEADLRWEFQALAHNERGPLEKGVGRRMSKFYAEGMFV